MGVRLDVRGMVCPQPTAIVRRCLAELEPGDELEVIGDDPPAKRSIRRSCIRHGFAVREGARPAGPADDHEAEADGDRDTAADEAPEIAAEADTFRLSIRATAESSIAAAADDG